MVPQAAAGRPSNRAHTRSLAAAARLVTVSAPTMPSCAPSPAHTASRATLRKGPRTAVAPNSDSSVHDTAATVASVRTTSSSFTRFLRADAFSQLSGLRGAQTTTTVTGRVSLEGEGRAATWPGRRGERLSLGKRKTHIGSARFTEPSSRRAPRRTPLLR